MLQMRKPLLLEGEAGVGKTEIAKVLATILDTPLIRLQCYEGLDANAAIYEWDYPRQMLYLQTIEATGEIGREQARRDLFSEEFLLKRPLLQAIDAAHDKSPVLLIDEVDRADQELEAFLLELLSDFQVTVPELGTIRAEHVPIVILTSNRTREIHDALKRRCLYYWIDFPTYEKEFSILSAKVPEAPEKLRTQICTFTQGLREVDLFKSPGWRRRSTGRTRCWHSVPHSLNPQAVDDTLGVILKYQEDVDRVRGDIAETSWNEPNVESRPRWSYLERTRLARSNLLTFGRDLRDAGMNIGSGPDHQSGRSGFDDRRRRRGRFLCGRQDHAGHLIRSRFRCSTSRSPVSGGEFSNRRSPPTTSSSGMSSTCHPPPSERSRTSAGEQEASGR